MSIFNGFFDNFTSALGNPKGNLGDFQHAAKLYTNNNMRLSPKFKHLYHVVFNIDPRIRGIFPWLDNIDRREINVLCKSADLPSYALRTETLNQYNRKRIIQTGVEYSPVDITFHDDNAGITTLLWESYFRYYYADSNYTERNVDGSPKLTSTAYINKSANGRSTMYGDESSVNKKFGLDRPNKSVDFFTSIQIFQMHPQNAQSTWTCYTLVNPKIDRYQHDDVNQEVSEFSVNRMTISYESVLYSRGYTNSGLAPAAFAETHYDKMPSPLTIAGGGTTSLFGTGGTIAGAANAISDLTDGNILSGLIKATNTASNLKNLSKEGLRQEGFSILESLAENAVSNITFPRSSNNNNTTEATPKSFKK